MRFLNKKSLVGLTVTILAVLSSNSRAEVDVIRLDASTSVQDNFIVPVQEEFTKATGTKIIKVKPKNAAQYFSDVIEGKVDAGITTINYEDWVKVATEEGLKITPNSNIAYRVIGSDYLTLMANSSVKVGKLSILQLADIFKGRIKNWKELGGPDVPVVILIPLEHPATGTIVSRMLLKGQPLRTDALKLKTMPEVIEKLSTTPGALLLDGVELKKDGVITLDSEKLGRPVTMITLGRPSAKIERLLEYVQKRRTR